MTSDTEKQNKDKETTELSKAILERIEKEGLTPLPRWQFLCFEYGIWTLWGLSVLFGAIVFSVLIFFFLHAGFSYAMHEATHENVFSFLYEVLPLLWIVAFGLMALLAHYNLRHTKTGYRHTVLRVLLSSLVFSFIGGVVFHAVGMGLVVDNFLAKKMPIFPNLEQVEARLWQRPEQGRIFGAYEGEGPQESIVLFADSEGMRWQLNTSELNVLDMENLYGGTRVHVIGIPSTTTDAYFHGCAIFKALLERELSFSEMRKERSRFLDRMHELSERVSDELTLSETKLAAINESLCGRHSAVKRVRQESSR